MALFTPQRFTLAAEHVHLLRRMVVAWQPDEFGAPEIDPKRPYGNSAVLQDIHEILTATDESLDDLSRQEQETLEARYRELHQQTTTALQVVLSVGAFTPGDYMADQYSSNWQPADAFQSRYANR